MQTRSYAIALLILAILCLGSNQQCASQAQLDLAKRLAPGSDLKKIDATKLALAKDQLCSAAFEANGGTCCDYESLKAFANQLIAQLKQQFAGIDSVISTFPSILEGLPKLLEHLALKDPSTNSDPDFIKAIGGEKAYYGYQAILQHLTTQAKVISEDVTAKKFDTPGCLKAIFNQKLSTLCLVCSPAAGKFFNENTKKFIFKKAGLQTVLTACVASFDIFNKVTHALQAYRVINKALSSKDALAAPPTDFSLEKMLKYEECRKNPDLCNNDNTKLVSMGSEMGGASKPPAVATRATENIASVPEIKASAATGFKDSISREKAKLETIKTEKLAAASQFNANTAGSPPKVLNDQVIEVNTLDTMRTTKYVPALTTLSTSTSTPTQITAANLDILNYAKQSKKRIDIYTKLKGVVERFISAAKDELSRTTDTTKSTGFVTNTQDGFGLLEKIKQASAAATELDPLTATVETAGTAITKDANEKYRNLVQKVSQLDADVKTALATLQSAIITLFTQVENRIKNEAAVVARNLELSDKRAQAVDAKKQLDALMPGFEAAKKEQEISNAKVAALTKIKTQLSGTLPVSTELTNALAEWTSQSANIKTAITDGEKVKTDVSTSTSASGLPQSIAAYDTLIKSFNAKIITRVAAIKARLDGTDATASALTTSITTTTASLDTLKTEIATQEAIIVGKQSDIATYKSQLPALQTDLYAKFATLQESFGKMNLQLAQIADYKGKLKTLESEYAGKTATLTAEKDSLTKLQAEKCVSTAAGYDQTYCAGLATKIQSLTTAIGLIPAEKQTATAPLTQQLTTLDAGMAALRTAHPPIQAAHDSALVLVKEKDIAIRTANEAINAAMMIISEKKRLIISKETENQVQSTSTSSFNTDIKTKVDEELAIQKTQLEALLLTFQKIGTLTGQCTSQQSVAPIKTNMVEFDAAISDLKLKDTSFVAKVQSFTTFKTGIEAKIQAQIAQVTTDITAATAAQNAAQTAFNTAKASFDAAKTQFDSLMAPPAPAPVISRRLRRVLEIASEAEDFEFNEISGADTANNFGAGVEVDTNLASTSTFAGATDPTKLDTTTAPASGNFSHIMTLSFVAFMAILAMLI